MIDRTDLIVNVMQAAEGEVVGKIRMQKIFYLLEQRGISSGLSFSYHHYGPYSEDLARSIDYAEIIDGALAEEPQETPRGSTFIAYKLLTEPNEVDSIGKLPFQEVERLVKDMKAETSIVIELAATIHWLKFKEKVDNWKAELVKRKTSKAEPRFIQRAEVLLEKLELS